jgi:hypothetical protein
VLLINTPLQPGAYAAIQTTNRFSGLIMATAAGGQLNPNNK